MNAYTHNNLNFCLRTFPEPTGYYVIGVCVPWGSQKRRTSRAARDGRILRTPPSTRLLGAHCRQTTAGWRCEDPLNAHTANKMDSLRPTCSLAPELTWAFKLEWINKSEIFYTVRLWKTTYFVLLILVDGTVISRWVSSSPSPGNNGLWLENDFLS